MACLRCDADGHERVLTRETLVGRSAECGLRLSGRLISKRHASLSWTGQRWEIRDLASKNGTYVDGVRLDPGGVVALHQDQRVDFGGEASWTLVDVRPPGASALALDTGEVCFVDQGHLALPSADDPRVLLHEHPRLGWIWEDETGSLDAAADGQVLTVAGRPFRLELGELDPTRLAPTTTRRLQDAVLRLTVSRDQEHVDLELVWPDCTRLAPPSTHWFTIVLLAHKRLADAADPELPPREHGWIHRDDLCRQLRTTVNTLNVNLHRLRGLLARVDVQDPASLYERRSSTGQLRIGTASIELLGY